MVAMGVARTTVCGPCPLDMGAKPLDPQPYPFRIRKQGGPVIVLLAMCLAGCEFDLQKRGRNTPIRTKRPSGFFSSGKIPHKVIRGGVSRGGARRADREGRILDRWLRGKQAEPYEEDPESAVVPPPANPDVGEFDEPYTMDPGPIVAERTPAPRSGRRTPAPRSGRRTPPPPRRRSSPSASSAPLARTGVGHRKRETSGSGSTGTIAKGRFHTVRKGEDLTGIAAGYDVSASQLARWNPREARLGLSPGQILYIPSPSERPASQLPASQRQPTSRRPMQTGPESGSPSGSLQARLPAQPRGRRPAPPAPLGLSAPGARIPGKSPPAGRTGKSGRTGKPPRGKPAPATETNPATETRTDTAPSKSSRTRPAKGFVWPVEGEISSGFGWRRNKPHTGVDIRAPKGTPVVASQAGKVIFSGKMNGYGNTIILDHGNGYFTVYGHNQTHLVEKRKQGPPRWVEQGETIARVGETGNATGPHLHFEIRKLNNPIDPLKLLPPKQLALAPRGP